MSDHFDKVKGYVLELGYEITREDRGDGVLVINDEQAGIANLVIGCAEPLLIMEQFMFTMKNVSSEVLSSLLKKNRDIIHGAFALDETGKKVVFRDTLQIENLDLNELEGSINSLGLLLSEYADQLITFSKN